ncbi:MAG: protein translocase subunit SecD [Acidobacteria bacterium]|nr:MAG: protein translocase subunit SecD [Acidobacteriota bacterium]
MHSKIRNRVIIILIVTISGLAIVLKPHHKPGIKDFTSWSQIKQNLSENIHLGLDLRGGSHLVMQVQTDEYISKITQNNAEAARTKLQEKNLPFTTVNGDTPGKVMVDVPDSTKNSDIVRELEADLGPDWSINEKGNSIMASLAESKQNELREKATEQAKAIIENRVNAFGVTEPTIARQGGEGTYQIVIQMPGVDDPERVKNTLNADSNLELKLVAPGTQIPYPTKEQAEATAKSTPPGNDSYTAQYEVKEYRDRPDAGSALQTGWVVLGKNPVVTGLDMRDASARSSQYGGAAYEIDFSLLQEGARRFGDATGKHIKDHLAIVLNNEVKSAPVINGQINDRGQISGSFTKKAAEDLALILRSGALPAKAVYLEERTVGPSLGADSIRQGVTASVAGMIAVVAFMLFYYRGSGINAVLALVLNLVLLLAALIIFEATLTLPGIAGVILTIGMAVDSNVLIFERIREEMRSGKVVASAVDVGFNKAFLTIIDTHVTTIVSAVFLFVFGTGPIRGFAVTLVAGLLANLFTAVFVSRTIFMWHLNRSARVETLSI